MICDSSNICLLKRDEQDLVAEPKTEIESAFSGLIIIFLIPLKMSLIFAF
jgi:hypothetical protein